MESFSGSSKYDVARALMAQASIYVHLDPRDERVVVPEMFLEQPQLVLQFGSDMPTPILDLDLDERGVRGTLAFNRLSFFCDIPWESVFAIVGEGGDGMVWPADIPDEIAREIERWSRAREFAGRIQSSSDDDAEPSELAPSVKRIPRAMSRPRVHPAGAAPGTPVPMRATEFSPSEATPSASSQSRADAGASSDAAARRPAKVPAAKRPLPSYLRVVK